MSEQNISKLKVLKSNAGFYVGRTLKEDGVEMPYDRESDYFESKIEAQKELNTMKEQGLEIERDM